MSQRMFDLGLYFETHEYLEGFWRREAGERRLALHGLIQVAAAFHKLEREPLSRRGAAELLERGLDKLSRSGEALGPGAAAGLVRRLEPLVGRVRSGGSVRAPPLRWSPTTS